MDGHQLLTHLGLTVRTNGPSGRYPTAHDRAGRQIRPLRNTPPTHG